MAKALDIVYVDSSVFLAYFNNEPQRGEIIDQYFDEARAESRRLITSTIAITEVAKVANEKAGTTPSQAVEAQFDSLWQDASLIEFVEVSEPIARNARTLMRSAVPQKWSLKPPDAIHLASAMMVGVKLFLTYDDGLTKYTALTGLSIQVPSVDQLKLF